MYVYRGRVNAGGQERGVDVGLALDLVRATYERRYEAAIIAGKDWISALRCAWRKRSPKLRADGSYSSPAFRSAPGAILGEGCPGRPGFR